MEDVVVGFIELGRSMSHFRKNGPGSICNPNTANPALEMFTTSSLASIQMFTDPTVAVLIDLAFLWAMITNEL